MNTPEDKQPQRAGRIRRMALIGSTLMMAGVMAVGGTVVGRSTTTTVEPTTSSARQSWSGWPGASGPRSGGPKTGGAPYGWKGSSGGQDQSLAITTATAGQTTGLVRIIATSRYVGSTAVGTGMVLTSGGEVVTNNHVVEDATRIRATVMATGKTYTVRLLGTDKHDDIAVLQLVGAEGLDTVASATDGISAGDAVTAVGDAEGGQQLSTASGTVIRLHRSITTGEADGTDSERLRGLIEVDADVVPGDSGGALLDDDREVVGMTTAASSGTANITGYAIPITKVLRIVDQVESDTETAKVRIGYDAFLGVELGTGSAARVAGVLPGTPAARTGLAAGDTITAVDGQPITSASELRNTLSAHAQGDSVAATWTDTTGSGHRATVTLTRAPVA